MRQIGIVGAGASGLCALRHVLATEGLTPIVWEHSSSIGGTWVYSEKTGQDEFGYPIHSSMYKNLRTDIPKEIMAFPDFPFKEYDKSFIHHSEVLQYLQDYADHFNLTPWIKFNHHVDSIKPMEKPDSEFPAWEVKTKDLVNKVEEKSIVDAIFICNGHFSEPRYPRIENIDVFKGKVMHSHDYRVPDIFRAGTVVVLGVGASGIDISLEISEVAEKVFFSHNLPLPFPSDLPSNIKQVKGVTEATSNGFYVADRSFIEADAIVFCTGYDFSFPFLSDSCGVFIKDNRVTPLHKHIVHSQLPSMGFIGIPSKVCPFPLFDVQVRYFLAVILKLIPLPLEVDPENQKKHFHDLAFEQWQYIQELNGLLNHPNLPPHYQNIWNIVIFRLFLSFTDFREFRYYVNKSIPDKSMVEELCSSGKVNWTTIDIVRLAVVRFIRIFFTNFGDIVKLLCTFFYKKIFNIARNLFY